MIPPKSRAIAQFCIEKIKKRQNEPPGHIVVSSNMMWYARGGGRKKKQKNFRDESTRTEQFPAKDV